MVAYERWVQRILRRLARPREIESHYEFIQFLNVKANRRIELVRRHADQQLCVLKVIDTRLNLGNRPLGFELNALRQLRHENIIRCRTMGRTRTNLMWFELQYIDGVNLDAYLLGANKFAHDPSVDLAALERLISWLAGIIRGVRFMHWKGWLHGDLCPANVMLANQQTTPIIIDFEYARPFTEPAADALPRKHSLEYAAPEEIKGKPLSVEGDYFAIGRIGQRLFSAPQLPLRFSPDSKAGEQVAAIQLACDQLVAASYGERIAQLKNLADILSSAGTSSRSSE